MQSLRSIPSRGSMPDPNAWWPSSGRGCMASRAAFPVRRGATTIPASVGVAGLDAASFVLVEEGASGMRSIQDYIASCFAQKYGARVPGFMPRLFGLRDAEGEVRGAVGLRRGDEALYLEQYLDLPIEQVIARRAGTACDRLHVSEVGHLCGSFAGVVRVLIDLVTQRLVEEDARWVTFTGTPRLRNAFARLGLAPVDVGPARAEALPCADRSAWGTYYAESPRVFIGSVRLGARILGAPEANLSRKMR